MRRLYILISDREIHSKVLYTPQQCQRLSPPFLRRWQLFLFLLLVLVVAYTPLTPPSIRA